MRRDYPGDFRHSEDYNPWNFTVIPAMKTSITPSTVDIGYGLITSSNVRSQLTPIRPNSRL